MKLYFGRAVTTATTLMILALLGFIGYSAVNHADIQYWGRRSAILLVFGLVVCCFAAAQDGLDKNIQSAIDGSCAPVLFPLVNVPTIVGCVGAALIVMAAVATPHRPLSTGAAGLVLRDVRRRGDEERDYGDCKAPAPLTPPIATGGIFMRKLYPRTRNKERIAHSLLAIQSENLDELERMI